MHSYSIDQKRIKVLESIGGVSFLSSLIILKIANNLVDYINNLPYINNIPYIPQIATFGIVFVGLFYLFDRYLWKISIAGLKLSKIPNLSGDWKGYLKTSHENEEIDIIVNIKQTWSSIIIVLKTENSKSKSDVALILLSKSRLVYQYFNEPSFSSPEALNKHYGTALLDYEENDILEGYYFTDRDRKNYGDIHLEKINS